MFVFSLVLSAMFLYACTGGEETSSGSSFDPAAAITQEDSAAAGLAGTVSLSTEMQVTDIGFGGTADIYKYTVADCDFIIRAYDSPKGASKALSAAKESYEGSLRKSVGWKVSNEGALGNSFDGVKGDSVRSHFAKDRFFYETAGFCKDTSGNAVTTLAGIVAGKI